MKIYSMNEEQFLECSFTLSTDEEEKNIFHGQVAQSGQSVYRLSDDQLQRQTLSPGVYRLFDGQLWMVTG